MVGAIVLSPTDAASQEPVVGSAQRVVVARARASRDQVLDSLHRLAKQPYSIVPSTSALNIQILSSRGALGLIYICVCVCVCFSSHSFWTSCSLDAPAGVTQEEGHTGFLIHLLSAVRALIFSREKDSAIPFPRRARRRILCTKTISSGNSKFLKTEIGRISDFGRTSASQQKIISWDSGN